MDVILQPMHEQVIMVDPNQPQMIQPIQPMHEQVIMVDPNQPQMIQPVIQPQVLFQPPPPQPHIIAPAPAKADPAVVIQPNLKDTPGRMKCVYCQKEVVTITKPINGVMTWAIFGTLLAFMIWPCCLIPFFVESCKDIEHTCPSCHNVVHIYKRM